jgi:glycosyltransferase involved in cell wall biosynthesis
MKICIVCTGYSSGFGGMETVYRKLCGNWEKRGHEIFIVSGFGSIQPPENCRVLKVPYISRKFFDVFRPFTQMLPVDSYELEGLSCFPFVVLRLFKLKPDIVLANTIFEAVAPLKLGIPCLMVSQAYIQNRLHIFKKVDRVIVNDLQSDERLKKFGVKTELLLNGVETSDRKIATQKLRAKYSIPHEAIVVLAVSRLISRKRIHLLINAFKLIEKPAVLFIIGSGPEFNFLKKQASQCNSKNKIIFLQNIAEDERNNFYQLADVFSLPSESEGMPLVLLEALSYGKPVVTNTAPEKKLILD